MQNAALSLARRGADGRQQLTSIAVRRDLDASQRSAAMIGLASMPIDSATEEVPFELTGDNDDLVAMNALDARQTELTQRQLELVRARCTRGRPLAAMLRYDLRMLRSGHNVPLTAALRSEDPYLREEAADQVGERAVGGLHEEFQALLDDEHEGVRQAARWALGVVGPPEFGSAAQP